MSKDRKLKDIVISRWDVVDSGDNPLSDILLMKSKGGQEINAVDNNTLNITKGVKYTMTLEEILAKLSQDEQDVIKTEFDSRKNEVDALTKAKDDTEEELRKAKEELEKASQPEEEIEEDAEEVIKSADPKVQEEFKKMQDRLKKSEDEKVEQDEKLNKLSDQIAKRDFVEKAKELPNISTDSDDLADILLDISKKAPESYPKVIEVFKTMNKRIEEGDLLKTVGKSEGEDNTSNVEGKLEKLAKTRAEADNITKEQATEKIMRENPELYEEYKNSQ